MSFGKIIFLCGTIFSFSIAMSSFLICPSHTTIPIKAQQEILKKNNPSCCRDENIHQPMFKCNLLEVAPLELSRQDVEKCMNIPSMNTPLLATTLAVFSGVLKNLIFKKRNRGGLHVAVRVFMITFIASSLFNNEIKKFRHEASAWLRELKEKEAPVVK